MTHTSNAPVYLAVDLGAGSGRVMAAILEKDTLTLEEVHRFGNDPVFLVDTWCWNTTGLFADICEGLRLAGERYGERVRSIGVDTWGVDYGLVDASGNLLGLPVQYRDSRNEGMMEKAFLTVPAPELYQATGNQFMAFNTVFQLLAEKTGSRPSLAAADRLLWMPDLLNFWLCGVKANESTIASTGQLVDAATGEWAWKVIDALDLPRTLFQDLVPPGRELGALLPHLRSATGLSNAKVVTVGSHDTASAVAAVPSDSPDSAYVSSGTWSLLGVATPDAVINDKSFDLAFTNEGGVGDTIRLLKNICGMWLIQECKREWDAQEPISWDDLVAEAGDAEPFRSLIDPDDPAFVAPGGMTARIQAWCRAHQQPVPETRGQVTRTIYESLALKYRVVFDDLETLVGKTLDTLHIVGGGSRNAMLNQFVANALNRPVVAGPVEATALGNVLVQLVADGAVADLDAGRALLRDSFAVTRYEPDSPGDWQAPLARLRQWGLET